MIARSSVREDTLHWRAELAQAYRDPAQLLTALGLLPSAVGFDPAAARAFPFRVTTAYAARMRPGHAADPLLRQVLPVIDESTPQPGFSHDPVGEQALAGAGNLLQKYAGRALLVMTGACAIHCRYCFRRSYPYSAHVGHRQLDTGLAAIAADAGIHEVILSGGDPLVLDDEALAAVFERLATMAHVRRVRIHTRLPIVLPARVTPRLLELFAEQTVPVVVVVHVNHAQEIDRDTRTALAACRAAGVTLLNQAVLLRGVNDDATVLAELCETLFATGVLPYYVHLLDRVAGAAHFAVASARARELEDALRQQLPGYLVPRFVREVAGAASKLPLDRLPNAMM